MTKVDVLPQETFKCNNVAEEQNKPFTSAPFTRSKPKFCPGKGKNRRTFHNLKKHNTKVNFVMGLKVAKKNFPDNAHNKRKNKNRRKRKWKPFCKMNWVERQKLEERDSKRANRVRQEMTAYGMTLAPYNTTQFLMEDHNVQEPDYKRISNGFRVNRVRGSHNSLDSSDEFYSSPEDEKEFLQRQFVQTYEDFHNERLENMPKNELVEEFASLEDKVEVLEKTLQEAKLQKKSERTPIRPPGFDVAAEIEKIRVFREEIEKLTFENDILERENEILRLRLTRIT